MVLGRPSSQDEGWVVCRAFKKPSPNQRPGYEAWNHAYYPRDQPGSSICNLRLQSSFCHSILDLAKPLCHSQAGETSANHQLRADHSNISQDHELLFSDHQHLPLTEVLPRLDSPLSAACNDEDCYDNGGGHNISNINGLVFFLDS
ncbi:hypothetical protein MLD38_033680 [Melastoma candidum]|uniref:Uncharacterized protein n=1 Tax=Melastoma candidum TaxID=119954 RepID=A0ACB9M787_9MYRT|nr:hypothetical protein MLD38_033680 [Melastoma candidum]